MSKVNSNFFSPLLLVSKSPRRAELLKKAGYQFESYTLEISEIVNKNLNPVEQVGDLTRFKMEQFLKVYEGSRSKYSFAMTFDTMVEFEGRNLGKPKDKNEALDWLLRYSGKQQQVHTGCCLYHFEKKVKNSWVSTTKVFFKNIERAQAVAYLESEPGFLDKAGGYGIQDENFNLVEKIEGEFSTVVGLPLKRLAEELKSE